MNEHLIPARQHLYMHDLINSQYPDSIIIPILPRRKLKLKRLSQQKITI